MTEYIEREKLLKKLHEVGGCGATPDTWADGYDKAIDLAYGIVQMTPAADVAEVKRGKWLLEREPDGKPYCFHCSVCDSDFHCIGITTAYDFCPNCGARMDGEGE